MIGLEVEFHGKTFKMALPPVITVFVTQRYDDFEIKCSGFDGNMHHDWATEELETGDEIRMTIKDIENSSDPIRTYAHTGCCSAESSVLSEEQRKKEIRNSLVRFRALEKILTEEGLLSQIQDREP